MAASAVDTVQAPAAPPPADPGHPGATARRTRLPGLDGLRAVAVAAVVVYHFAGAVLPGGLLGVDVFFVISGFLITRLLVVEYLDTGRIGLGAFYRRRARRLLPALAVVLASTSAAALVWRDQLATLRPAVLAAATYVSNWWLVDARLSYFVATGRPSMLQHLWSLAVEEQFYLLWPALVILVLGARSGAAASLAGRVQRVHRLAALATVLGLVSAGLLAIGAIAGDVPYGSDGSRLYYGTDTHCLGLLLGAAVGARSAAGVVTDRYRGRTHARPVWPSDVVGALALLALLRLTATLGQYQPQLFRTGFLVVSLLACVVVATVTRAGSRVGAALDCRPLRWVGQRSYGIYLWHWPVAVVTRPGIDVHGSTVLVQTLRIGLTLGLAAASYRWVELPIRTGGVRAVLDAVAGVPRHRGLAVGVTTLAFVAAGVLIIGPTAPEPAAAARVRPAVSPSGAPPAAVTTTPVPHATVVPTAPVRRTPASTTPVPTTPAPAPLAPPAPAPLAPPTPPPPPPVSAFGDSVMLGAGSALATDVPGIDVDAVVGAQERPLLADIRSRAAAGRLGSQVVVHTGDNGIIDPADLTATLRALAGARRVVLLTVRVARDWQDPNNATIRSVAAQFPNAVVVDWDAAAGSHPDWLWNDGLHLRPAGSSAYAALIAAALLH